MIKKKNSKWYYNKSQRDIVIAELDLTIKSGWFGDLFTLKPSLRSEYVSYSEKFGVIKGKVNSGDLILLDGPPKKNYHPPSPKYYEAKVALSTRVRSCVEIDPADKDFIENLESEFLKDTSNLTDNEIAKIDHQMAKTNDRFVEEVDLEGFVDPLADEE